MGRLKNWSTVLRQTAVKKLNLVMRFLKGSKLPSASICGRSWSLDDQCTGLRCNIVGQEITSEITGSVRELQRLGSIVTEYYSCSDGGGDDGDDDDDIDERAEIFILDFRRHLWYERQRSLQELCYGRGNYSFE